MEAIILLLLLLANGVFAMSETALISAKKARLQALAETGNARARVALETAEHPIDFLSTVQIGITLIGVLAGAFGGATFAQAIARTVALLPALAPYSEAIGVGVVVLVITYLSLVIGELVPKQIALTHPERIAAMVARPMQRLTKLSAPFVKLLTTSTQLMVRLLRIQATTEPPITSEEVQTLVTQGTQVGVFEAAEQEMVKGVLRLDETTVGTLMTPRMDVVWLEIQAPPAEIRRTFVESQRSRLPVAEGNLDQVLGIVHAKDFVTYNLEASTLDLKPLLKPALYFPESMSALKALAQFKQSGIHFAFVIDEYGGVEGVVTSNDILEAIVGDIYEPGEAQGNGIIQREDGSWLLDGLLSLEKVKAVLQVEMLPEGETYQTLGGFVFHQLGAVPQVGQQFEWHPFRFEVVDMDGLRVDKVLVTPLPQAEQPQGLVTDRYIARTMRGEDHQP